MSMNFCPKNKCFYIFIFIFFVAWFFYHFITINISPLPNFDEVFFSDISNNVHSKGGLYLSINKLPGEKIDLVLAYGPIYFYIHSYIINFLGLDIITGRLISLISGLIISLLFLYFTKKTFKDIKYVFGVILLLITDYRFNMSMHSGRMDLLAVLFFIIALFFVFNSKNIFGYIFAGLFISFSFLTTPRISFYFVGLIFLFFYDLFYGQRSEIKYLIIGIVSSFIIFLWIYFQFGSIESYIDYLSSLRNHGEKNTFAINKHLGINGLSFHLLNPAFIFLYIITGFLLYYKRFEKITLFVFILVLSHVFFILEQGPYSAMILPFVYWLIVFGLLRLQDIQPLYGYMKKSLLILLIFNLAIFSAKSYFIFIKREGRNINYVAQKLYSFDFSNKYVLSNYEYYYFVNRKKGKFTSIELVNDKLNDTSINKFHFAILDIATAKKFEDNFAEHIEKKVFLKHQQKSDFILTDILSRDFNVYHNYDGCFYVLK